MATLVSYALHDMLALAHSLVIGFDKIQIYTTNNNVVNYDPQLFLRFLFESVYGWVDICH